MTYASDAARALGNFERATIDARFHYATAVSWAETRLSEAMGQSAGPGDPALVAAREANYEALRSALIVWEGVSQGAVQTCMVHLGFIARAHGLVHDDEQTATTAVQS